MSIIKSIERNHYELMAKRGWSRVYYFFDIHGTILRPNYQYGNTPNDFYPYAKETLQLISQDSTVCICLYTCSHPHEIDEYVKLFKDNSIRVDYINENPEVKTDLNGYGCYDKKPYMNVLFEDKAGFDPEIEWEELYNYLINKNNGKKESSNFFWSWIRQRIRDFNI